MKHIKKVLSFVMAIALIVGMIPMSAITAHASSWEIKNGGEVCTGQTATLTCQGGASWQITNVIFESTVFPTIAKVTGYDSDGTITYEKDIFGGYNYSKTFCYGGDKYVIEVMYGAIELSYNTANTFGPTIECQENGLGMEYLIRPNLSTIYLKPGETQELFIKDVYPGYEAELRGDGFVSDNSKIASVTSDGMITANSEGTTQIDIFYTFYNSKGEGVQLIETCDVIVVDDEVDKNSGLRFYYSDEEIEPGDIVQIGADYSYGNFTGMYYPGTVEWKVSNEDVLKVIQTTDNITKLRVEALAMGECDLSLVLDGEVKCTETINVSITDSTLISMYKDYLMDCAAMTTLSDARNTCWDVIERYSSGNKARIAFMTCLESDLGLSIITKEAAAAIGLTSSTHEDTVDEAIVLLMTEIFSSEEGVFSDSLSTFKKRFETYGAFTKTTSFIGGSVAPALANMTSFSESQIKSVEELANDFIGEGITMAELVSGAVMTVQYERDVVVSLMNTIASAPGGTSSDLYKGLERILFEMDNLKQYVATRYLNNKMVAGLKKLIEKGLFSKDAKIFNKTVWDVASGMGYLISRSYAQKGGVFANDYMKACITAGFAGTLCSVVKNSDSAAELEYSFKFYVSSVKVALNAAIDICDDAMVNCSDLKLIAKGYLNQIEATCTYENLLEQCREAVVNASDVKHNVYMEDDKIVVDVYWELPETRTMQLTDENTGDFYTTGYTSDQLVIIPSHINGEKVTGIAANGFKVITNKYGIVLPDSIVKIGDYAFSDCPQVTFVVLGDNLKEIGAYAFNNNSALQAVSLPSNLEIIKEGAFNNCCNISSIITEADQIDSKAFNNCTSLSTVTIKNKNAVIAEDAFDNCSSGLTIYGYKNTSAEEIATSNGYTFVELSETVSSIKIATPANKTEYEVDENIVTDGMTLNVTYLDGTSEVITDGWVAYGNTSVSGESTVKIYYGDKIATYTITVKEDEAASIKLEYSELTMMFGQDIQLSAQFLPDESKNVKIVWTTSNSDVATVDSNGFVEAIGTGTAIIIAKSLNSDVNATCKVTVVDTKNIDPTATKEDYITFTARENGYYVFYSTDSCAQVNGCILDINGNTIYSNSGTNFRVEGQLHKDKTYTFKTTTEASNNAFQVAINKSVEAESVVIKDEKGLEVSEISGYPNDKKNLYYGFTPVNYITETCTWESSDITIATVNTDGKVTLVAPGTAKITVTSENGLTDICEVTVKEFVEAPAINVGETKTVTISGLDEKQYFSFTPEEDGWYVFYSKEDTNGRSHYGTLYEADGTYIKGGINYWADTAYIEHEYTAGKTYIIQTSYISSYNGTGTYEVCLDVLPPANSLTIVEGDSFEGYPFEKKHLSAEFTPKFHIPDNYVWSSSNTEVATVSSNGNVSLLNPGTATITVTSDNGLSDSCEITVKDFPVILLNETKTIEITEAQKVSYYSFTPEEDGSYAFYSVSDADTYCSLYNSLGSRLIYDNDSGADSNFRIEYQMMGGETYIFKSSYENSNTVGTFDVKIKKMIAAESLSVVQGENLTGYINENINLSVEFVPTDCIEENVTWDSSDENVVSVDEYGCIDLLKVGTATITVTTENGLTDSIVVTVIDIPEVILNEVNIVEVTSNNQPKRYKFTPSETATYSFEFESDYTVYFELCDEYDNCIIGLNNTFNYQLIGGKTYYIKTHDTEENTNSYSFKISKIGMTGDVNRDGKISVADARELVVAIAKGNTEEFLEFGDVNNDGKISVADARKIVVAIAKGDFDF